MSTWDGYNKQIAANRFQQTFVINHIDISGRLLVRQDASLNSRLFVVNDASFMGNVFVNRNLIANSKFIVNQDASLNSRLFVASDASFMGNVFVNGNLIANSRFILNQDASFNRLSVLNDASFMSNVYVNNILTVNLNLISNGDASLNSNVFLRGDISCNGNLSIGRNLIVSGNLAVKNYTNQNIINTTTTNYQLVIAEDLSLNGRLAVSGDSTFNGIVQINGNIGIKVAAPLGPFDISGSLVRTTVLPTGNLYIGGTLAHAPYSNGGGDTWYPPVFVATNKNTNTLPPNNSLTIENTNNASSTAHSMLLLRTGGTGGGSPYVSYDSAGDAGWSHGAYTTNGDFWFMNSPLINSNPNLPIMTIKNGSGYVGTYATPNPNAFLQLFGSPANTNYNNAPDWGPTTYPIGYHNLILSTAYDATLSYGMTLGVDKARGGFGYIAAAGRASYRPLCLQTTGGNVGIGTTNPLEKLHVMGGLKIQSASKITCIDAGIYPNSPNVGSGTITFNTTFPNVPIVLVTIIADNPGQLFSITVDGISTTSFNFYKNWRNITSVATGGGTATGEQFYWIAIGTA